MITVEYKTVYGPIDDVDADLNALAKEGWRVQGFESSWVDIDETGHTPYLSYLMVRQVDDGQGEQPVQSPKPERRVLGRSG